MKEKQIAGIAGPGKMTTGRATAGLEMQNLSPGPVEIWNQPIKGSLVPEPSKRENLKSLIYSELITNRACSETVGYALHKIMNAVDTYAYELSKDTADDMPTDEEIEDMRWKV